MVLEHSQAKRERLALGQELLPGAAAALRDHVDRSGLGAEISANAIKALSSDGRLLEAERDAALGCLVLLAHESAGGRQHSDAYTAVMAMECLLAAGDVLDDIQDGDLELKGWESVAVAAETMAALLVLAHGALVSEIGSPTGGPRVARAIERLIALEAKALQGQGADVRTSIHDVSKEDALEITRAKSGALGRCAAEMGACLATDDERMIRLHGDFGEHLAVVFQLMNDIAGIWPGSTSSSDFDNHRPTPLLGFLSSVGAESHESLDRDGATGSSNLVSDQRWESHVRSGAVQFTWALATAELAKARRKSHEIETLLPLSRLSLLLRR